MSPDDPRTLTVGPLAAVGEYPIRANFCETFWLPVVGPTAYCAARVLSQHAEPDSSQRVYSLHEVGSAVGVTRYGRLQAALSRLGRYHLAEVSWDAHTGNGTLLLARLWPDLPERLLAQQTASLQAAHALLTAPLVERPTLAVVR